MQSDKEISLKDQVRRNLKRVVDPEIGINIVDLGLIYGIDVNEENDVQVTMTLTAPNCPFGELIMMTATAQFCRSFSSLPRAGVPILMAMEISSQTAGNSIISDAILKSRTLVQEGVLLSTSLIRQKGVPDMALSMLAIGEETGEMDKMLSKVADFYEDEVGAIIKALTSMLETAIIVVLGGIVGSILLAIYLPMFTVFYHIQ